MEHPKENDAADAHSNFIGAFGKLVDHVDAAQIRTFGSVTVFATGVPVAIFNGGIVSARPRDEDLAAALEWLLAAGAPFELWIHEALDAELTPHLTECGLASHPRSVPHMILRPVPDVPPPRPGLRVRPVRDEAALEESRAILAAGGLPIDVGRRIFPDTMRSDDDVRIFLVDLDGRPAGTAMAIRTGDVSGVYAVETLHDARRRGVGTAATWATIGAARAWGARSVALQSSAMGLGVYEAIGFRTVARYTIFGPEAA